MPACEPWISQAVLPGLSFSWITQRACTPSGPEKVAGPGPGLALALALARVMTRLAAGLGDAACGVLLTCSAIPVTTPAATSAVTAAMPMTALPGNGYLLASPSPTARWQTIYDQSFRRGDRHPYVWR